MINWIRTWTCDSPDLIAERELAKRLENEMTKRLETELAEAHRLLRVRDRQRDALEETIESMDQRIISLKSEVKRLKGYETAVRELNRSVEILAEDVPF